MTLIPRMKDEEDKKKQGKQGKKNNGSTDSNPGSEERDEPRNGSGGHV